MWWSYNQATNLPPHTHIPIPPENSCICTSFGILGPLSSIFCPSPSLPPGEVALLKTKNIYSCNVPTRIRHDRFLPPVHKVTIILLELRDWFLSAQLSAHTDQQYLSFNKRFLFFLLLLLFTIQVLFWRQLPKEDEVPCSATTLSFLRYLPEVLTASLSLTTHFFLCFLSLNKI